MPDFMLEFSPDGRSFTLDEPCGIEHRPQVIDLPLPPGEWRLVDADGAEFPVQRSRRNPERGFARVGVGPYEKRTFRLTPGGCAAALPVAVRPGKTVHEFDNGILAIRVCAGEAAGGKPCTRSGPIVAIRREGGDFFGQSWFDTLEPLGAAECELLEGGPLRAQARFFVGNRYSALITLDAGEDFCEIDETFDTFEGDQLVWGFAGDCLPRTAYVLDSTPCFETRALGYELDREVARLGCWSQQSQMNLCDGFAFRHPAEDTVWGAIAFEGGLWQGNRGNSLDAMMRRLRNGCRATRRLLPPGAKADTLPGPAEAYNPVRDRGDCSPMLCLEANLGKGRRKWGLMVTTRETLTPPAGGDAAQIRAGLGLSHFENRVDGAFCNSLQSPLRKRHIEHIIPFRELVKRNFDPGTPGWREWGVRSSDDFFHEMIAPGRPDEALDSAAFLDEAEAFLDARVVAFWDGAGIASTNPVCSRRVGPCNFLVEELAAKGVLGGERLARLRRRFLFLAMLNSDQGFYAGKSAMLPPCDPDSFDPPMRGMANQNFYTDVIAIHGMAGLLYSEHPDADAWAETFVAMFRRQLEIHTYPSGLWEESHTYNQHVLLTVLPPLLMLKAAGRYDFFADEKFRKMVAAVMEQISVADFSTGSKRGLLPFGDHAPGVEPYHLMWHAYAEGFRDADPALAAKLNFLAKESGGAYLADLPQTPPERGFRELKGLGVFFRGVTREGDETLFALRGGCAWAHHHNDDGSIQLYCGDRMLIGDAGHSGRRSGAAKIADFGHSRWTLPGVEILNYLWRFNRGWVTARSDGETPYATVYTPALFELRHGQAIPLPRAIRHFRSVVKLAEQAFLVLDSTLEPVPERILFHLGAPEFTAIPGGAVAKCGDIRVRVRSLEGLTPQPGPVIAGEAPEREMTTCRIAFEPPVTAGFAAFLIDFGRELGESPLPEFTFDSGVFRLGDITLDHREECL